MNYINIYTDQGRFIRPVIQVDNNIPRVTQKDLDDI